MNTNESQPENKSEKHISEIAQGDALNEAQLQEQKENNSVFKKPISCSNEDKFIKNKKQLKKNKSEHLSKTMYS